MNDRIVNPRALEDWSHDMKRDWDDRARRDAKWFINPLRYQQSDSEFDESGAQAVQQLVLADLDLLAPGLDCKSLRVLELGCGIGRMTRFLAGIFGEVHATDVSGEMIRQARVRLSDLDNVKFHENSGYDFAGLPTESFDLAFSAFVFQHVPSVEIICSNLRDAYRLLKPGGFFKFQVNSLTAFDFEEIEKDTWMGASLPESDLRRFAEDVGAQIVSLDGSGSQRCWSILRKRSPEDSTSVPSQPLCIVFYGQTDRPSQKEIPINGAHGSLTLLVTGLDSAAVDCNSVCADISGLEILPNYVGPVRERFLGPARSIESVPLDSLTRIDLTLPVGAPTGAAEVRIQLTSGVASPPVTVAFVAPQPVIPRIVQLGDAANGGSKLRPGDSAPPLRLHVEGLDETADCGNIRVQIGERILKPTTVTAIDQGRLHRVEVQLPGNLSAGPSEARLYFGTLESPPVSLEVLPAGDSV